MTISRRTTLAAIILAGAAATGAMWPAATAQAQDWPTKPVRIVIGFGAGGGTDIVTRIIAQPLSEALAQPFVVDNKPGAGGTIGADLVAKAAKDGYTALMISTGHTVAAVMYKSLPYESVKDFEPVAMVANTAMVFAAHKDFKAGNIKELIAAAKAAPGKIKFGTVGLGSTQHFSAELLRQMADIDIKHIAYRNTPALVAALRSTEIDFLVEPVHTVIGQIRAGDLKALAIGTPKRWAATPDIPTVAESGVPGYDVLGWYGLVYPAGTAKAVIAKTHDGLRTVLEREAVKEQIAKTGALVNLTSAGEFGQQIATEIAKWRMVRDKAGLEAK
ncbi:MAG: tripartite tricarboxylate transporter substrate binding protein [Proteobacteria bacterium]|nr:tripartite tricarboxylate transporter substrate binding protein [Pseudomonadota bacterium]